MTMHIRILFLQENRGGPFLSFDGAKEVGVEFYSLSKSYNLTGARISFVVGNKAIVEKFKTLRSQIDYGIFLPIQKAAIAALTGPDDFIEKQRQEYAKKKLCAVRRSAKDRVECTGQSGDNVCVGKDSERLCVVL